MPVQLRSGAQTIFGLFFYDLRAICSPSHVAGLTLRGLLGRVVWTHSVAIISTAVQAINIDDRTTRPSELWDVLCSLVLARPTFILFLVYDLETVMGLVQSWWHALALCQLSGWTLHVLRIFTTALRRRLRDKKALLLSLVHRLHHFDVIELGRFLDFELAYGPNGILWSGHW